MIVRIFLFFSLALACPGHTQKIILSHVEPGNWWVGMKHHQVQVLLHGPQIANYTPSVQGLNVIGISKTENPNYLFITVETQDKNAGTYPIILSDNKKKEVARFEFKLEERIYQSANREGFSSKDVIYLLMPDRFSNVITGQDTYPGMTEPVNRDLPGGRHGGDILGIIEHLSYIKELGVTTIWTTPLLEDNEPTYSYHGYAQSDLYKVDPRYGTNSWFKEMVLEAHRQGLKVIKDEVPNHWSSKHWMMNDLPTKTWIHEFPTFTRSSYRTSTQMDPYASESDVRASEDAWFDTSMPDMNQSNPLLLNYLIQNTLWWIEFACLDGLRVDTYSYNDKQAIAKWTQSIMEEYPNLNIVGEIWLHNQAQISYWQKESPIGALESYNSGLPSVMDFTLHDAITQAFSETKQGWDQGMVRIYENFVNDFLYKNPNNLLVFMENHDTKRFNEIYPNLADYKLALTLLSTTRGIPQIYYGSEIGMKGSKEVGDADIRRDFPGGWPTDKQTAFYANDDKRRYGLEGRTPEQEAYFQFTKKLLNWRKNKEVIHEGKLVQYVPENNVYVYFRIQESEVGLQSSKRLMVVLNNSLDEQKINLDRFEESLDVSQLKSVPIRKEILSDLPLDFSQKTLTIPGKNGMDNRTLMKAIFVFVAMVFNTVAFCQNPSRQFKSIESINAGLKVSVSDGVYIFRTYGPNIIETTFIPNGQKHEANSHAVVSQPDNNPFTWATTSNTLIPPFILIYSKSAKSKGINPSIIVQTNPFKISYFYKGKYLLSERWGYDVDSTMEKIQFNLSEGEKLFGTGNRVLGMDRRGYRLPLYNRAHYGYETHSEQMNFSMPLVISDRLYALHFDNSYTGFLDLDSKKDSSLTYEMTGGRKTYQVIAATDYKELVSAYTSLTGRQPMPPRWAFGNFASRFGYHSEQEARTVVSKFRADSIPLDAIIFDLYWFGKDIQGTLGNFAFYTDSFPTPQKMINDFSDQKVNTVLITEPFILTTSNRWQEAKDKKLLAVDSLNNPFTYDFYFGNTGLIDIYAPHAKKWFWNIYAELANMGVKGFWGDLGEPEAHPSKLLHANGVSADQVHNIYGHDWARLIYEGYKTTFPLERPFILMRAGYSGSQRFGMIPWTGDVNRSWGGLKPQMELTMQMGMQGIAYMHSDLGGFAGANDDPELYVRWLQYGVFQPIFRPHAQQEVASEAIFKDEKTKQLAKEAIELRYQLLPYNYTLAFENHLNGTPLMRPIFMEITQASWADTITNEFMWGPSLLVKPITNPILKNTLPIQVVRAPNGTWYDLRSGKQRIENYQPNQTNQHEAHYLMPGDLSGIPVLVKGGAFIPMSPTIQSTKEYADSSVTIHYYDDKDIKTSQGQWYEDDGLTNEAYEKGLYKLLRMTMKQSNRQSTLLFIPEYGKSCSQMSFSFEVCIHSKRMPKNLILNGKKNIPFVVDQKTQTIRLTTHLSDKQSRLKIKW